MCRVLPFPPPPDDATRDLLSMVTDDLQILAIHEPPTVLTAARLIAARANATRTRRWGTAPGAAPADDDLPRVTRSNLRLLAVYNRPQFRALALEVVNLTQPVRVHLAGTGRRSALRTPHRRACVKPSAHQPS